MSIIQAVAFPSASSLVRSAESKTSVRFCETASTQR